MQEARDDMYCHLTARRAVARAALHLGIDTMSQEAIDTLAGVLLEYLGRIGRTLATLTEASGRSSAHCNVLQCIRAVEICTEPAVQRVHLDSNSSGVPSAGGGGSAQGHLAGQRREVILDPVEQMSWKGLATFCFGPNWASQPESKGSKGAGQPMERTSIVGGKVGPSVVNGEIKEEITMREGWVAPFPDEILPFPVVANGATANPHALSPSVADSLHNLLADKEEQEGELSKISDAVFTDGWGGLEGDRHSTGSLEANAQDEVGSKRKRGDSDQVDGPMTKRARTRDGDNAVSNNQSAYIPIHFPSFPRASEAVGQILTEEDAEESSVKAESKPASFVVTLEKDPSLSVRSALIRLGQPWGSGWDKEATSKADGLFTVSVPEGRTNEAAALQPQIVPLNRASGSRVSRILEGSMDTTTS